jgi:transcriptional regulator of acetoin/glycerol metabolism
VVLADSPMLTQNEFPQIAAHVTGAAAEALPAEIPAPPTEPLEIDLALPAMMSVDSGILAAFGADGDLKTLAEIEAAMIRLALERYQGRMSLIARRLGIGRSTLYRKLKELGISDTVVGIAAEVR